MKKITTSFLLLITAMSLMVSSCGQKGDTGPVGPQGPQGNANVYSLYYQVLYSDWNVFGMAGQPNHSLYFEKYIPQITQAIIDNGMVACYMYDYDIDAWVALPYTYTFAGVQEFYKYYIQTGLVGIDITLNTLQTPIAQNSIDVKVVVVSGYLRAQNQDLDWNNYEAVRERLGIE